MSRMPRQQSSTSRQDYETPPELIEAVSLRFGALEVDLACGHREQTTMPLEGLYPDTRKAPIGLRWPDVDSLSVSWAEHYGDSICWLNPPFKDCDVWAAKCAREAIHFGERGRIILLTPASVGANWFTDSVWLRAQVIPLSPRITFVGEADAFPKDCMLSIFGRTPPARADAFEPWRWVEKIILPPRAPKRRVLIEVD